MIKRVDFFDVIDTSEKAYWLGFLTADGSIHQNGRLVEINLQKSDVAHLERLKLDLLADNNIYEDSVNNAVRLVLCSEHLVNALRSYGLMSAKSLIVKPYKVRFDFEVDYWRGMVDGDGSICQVRAKRKGFPNTYRKVWNISLNGTHAVTAAFRNFLYRRIDVCKGDLRPHYSIWKAKWAGTKACVAIARLLYSDAAVSLCRKNKLAQQLIAI